jgi:hypothetical protein
MFTLMRATIPGIVAQVTYTDDTRSRWESLEINLSMESEDDEIGNFIIFIFIFLEELILWKCTFTSLEKFPHGTRIIGHDAKGYRKSTHHEKLEYPSHVAIIIYDIREYINEKS